MQLDLERLGYDVGGADGIYGPTTVRDVMAFRAEHGLGAVWFLDDELCNALDKALIARPTH